ncbi:MAG: hypothetical protein FWF54_03660 [Candidatus Azobacteroides sp.]|nr:hypothetical protein [Candidatus Azobacteroides sp.]
MNKIGDWLYIIFIGIAIISSLISNVTKKKPKENTVPPVMRKPQQQASQTQEPAQTRVPGSGQAGSQPKKAPSWIDILQSLEEKEPEKPQSRPAHRTKIQPKGQAQSSMQVSSQITNEIQKPVQSLISQKIAEQNPATESEPEFSVIDLRLNDLSEIKKGIIYSEIFNRKY